MGGGMGGREGRPEGDWLSESGSGLDGLAWGTEEGVHMG